MELGDGLKLESESWWLAKYETMDSSKRRALVCSICQPLWCKYSCPGGFQATDVMCSWEEMGTAGFHCVSLLQPALG